MEAQALAVQETEVLGRAVQEMEVTAANIASPCLLTLMCDPKRVHHKRLAAMQHKIQLCRRSPNSPN
jgi:hypothetical protein